MEVAETYQTISAPSAEILYKEKGSKFFGYAFPVNSENEVKEALDSLRKQHHGAVHFCYAYQMGTDTIVFRANDDGEPSNSAGMPIYGQIRAFNLTNILVVVVRFFGGVKLGVGGLMSAYKISAQMALEQSEVIEKTITVQFTLTFDYPQMNKAMRLIKENNFQIISHHSDMRCHLVIEVRKNSAAAITEIFTEYNGISVVKKD